MKLITKLTGTLAIAMLAMVGGANAAITLNLGVGNLYADAGATTLFPATGPTGTLVLIADTGNDGFGDFTVGNAFSSDANDIVFGIFGTDPAPGGGPSVQGDGVTQSVFAGGYVYTFADGVAANQNYGLLWFPGVDFSAGLTAPGGGEAFGFAALGQLPSDGQTIGVNQFTTGVGGILPENTFAATQVTIPEPTTAAMLLGAFGLMALRRRSARA